MNRLHHDRLYIICKTGDLNEIKHYIDTTAFSADPVFLCVCYYGNLNAVKYVIERYKTQLNFNEGLCNACSCGHLDIVKYLIEGGYTNDVHRAFMYACYNNVFNIVEYFIEERKITEVISDIYLARYTMKPRMIKYLVEKSVLSTDSIPNRWMHEILNIGLNPKLLQGKADEYIVARDMRNKAITEILLSNTNVNDDVVCIVCSYTEYAVEY